MTRGRIILLAVAGLVTGVALARKFGLPQPRSTHLDSAADADVNSGGAEQPAVSDETDDAQHQA